MANLAANIEGGQDWQPVPYGKPTTPEEGIKANLLGGALRTEGQAV